MNTRGLPSTNTDTTHQNHWMQAYYEIYNAAYNTTGWISPDALDNLIKTNGNSKKHPIGILCYKFNGPDTTALQDHLIGTLANASSQMWQPGRNSVFTIPVQATRTTKRTYIKVVVATIRRVELKLYKHLIIIYPL